MTCLRGRWQPHTLWLPTVAELACRVKVLSGATSHFLKVSPSTEQVIEINCSDLRAWSYVLHLMRQYDDDGYPLIKPAHDATPREACPTESYGEIPWQAIAYQNGEMARGGFVQHMLERSYFLLAAQRSTVHCQVGYPLDQVNAP